jgi:hypothetical protein
MSELSWPFATLTSTQIGASVVVFSIARGSKGGASCWMVWLRFRRFYTSSLKTIDCDYEER